MLLEASERPLMQVAMEVGISPSMLRKWLKVIQGGTARSRAVPAATPPMQSPADQASEIARLKRELDRARMERDVLNRGGSDDDPGDHHPAKAIGMLTFGRLRLAEVPR